MSYLNVQDGVDANGNPTYISGAGDAPAAYVAPTTPKTPAVGTPTYTPPASTGTMTASGVVTGVAPAGSLRSASGNYVGPDGTQYSSAPGSSAAPSIGSVYGSDYSPAALNTAGARSADFALNGLDQSSQDQIRADTLKSFQAEIDATNKIYADKLARAKVTGADRLGSTTAIEGRRGLLGSDFGAAQTDKTVNANEDVYGSIDNEKAAALATINSAGQRAVTDALAAKTAAKQQGLDAYLKYLGDASVRAGTSATTAATLLINNKQDPNTIDATTLQNLLQNYGISKEQLTSAYVTGKAAANQAAAKAAKDNQTILSPGQSVFGADGKVLASLPPKDTYTVVKGTTTTDAFGNQSVSPDRVFDSTTGKFVGTTRSAGGANLPATGSGGSSSTSIGTGGAGSGGASLPGNKTSGLNFAQYGNLANTDFNPKAQLDQLAQKYLDTYIKKGALPSSRDLGTGIKAAGLAQIDSRARELYQQATGNPFPTPEILGGYQDQLIGNNKLLNNLTVQEGIIRANSDLLLKNINAANINQHAPLINDVLNNVLDTLGDPKVAAYLAQHSTIQNELGSLLAIKNSQGGATVHDKLVAGGLIKPNASAGQIAEVVKQLMQEAVNAHAAIKESNGELYKQTDPLLQDSNNPARAAGIVNSLLSRQGIDYNELIGQMQAVQSANPGKIPALDVSTGQPFWVTQGDISTGKYVAL